MQRTCIFLVDSDQLTLCCAVTILYYLGTAGEMPSSVHHFGRLVHLEMIHDYLLSTYVFKVCVISDSFKQ